MIREYVILFFVVLVFMICVYATTVRSRAYHKWFSGGADATLSQSLTGADVDIVKDLKLHPRTKSEALAVQILEGIIGESCPSVNPGWLKWKGKTLELDGYCASKKIALEFSGPMHTKWTPSMETYPQYFNRVVRDVVKRRMCARHGVVLIVIDMTLPRHHISTYIKSRLYDARIIDDMPAGYIHEQRVKPYRDRELESKLKLTSAMIEAKAL